MNWPLLFTNIFTKLAGLFFILFCESVIGLRVKKRKFIFLRAIAAYIVLTLLITALCFFATFILSTKQINYDTNISIILSILIDAVTLILSLSYIQICFDTDSMTTIVIAIIGYNAYHLIYCLFFILTSAVFYQMGMDIYFNIYVIYELHSIITYILYIFVFTGVILFIYFLFIKNKDLDISVIRNRGVFPLFVVSVLIHLVAHNYALRFFGISYVNSLILIVFICEGMLGFIVLLLQFALLHHDTLKSQKEMEEQRIAIMEKNYHFSKDIIEQINIKAHDLKHQIRNLKKENRIDDEVASSIYETIDIYEAMAKTENETINVVLSEKWIYCNKHHISFSVIVDSNIMAFMKKSDIYSLLGNVLDNAIEASLKLPYEQRAISLVIKEVMGCVNLQVRNNFNGTIKLDKNGRLKTIKEDDVNHGFGSASIRYIVNKYGGEVAYNVEKDVFILQIVIPIPSE